MILPAALLLASMSAAAAPPPETLSFSVIEGSVRNYFYRRGGAAAHVLASSGASPRLIAAFPAANSGIGVWFSTGTRAATLELAGDLAGVERQDGMRGVTGRFSASGPLRAR